MQSRGSPLAEARRLAIETGRDLAPGAVLAAFAPVPDPRRAQGRRFPLPAILARAVPAVLANHLSLLAIAEWGAAQPAAWLAALGFPTSTTPHPSTLHRLFRQLDPRALSAALSAAFAPTVVPPPRGAHGVAIDGKAQRGRLAGTDAPATP